MPYLKTAMSSILEKNTPTSASKVTESDVTIEELQLGVWNIKSARDPTAIMDFGKYWDEIKSALPLLIRLTSDIFKIAPGLFTIFILSQIWQGIEDSLLLHFSNKLLRTVEAGIVIGEPQGKEIVSTVIARLSCTIFVSWLQWHSGKVQLGIQSRVTRHFELVLMKANLKIDLTTSQEPGSKQETSAGHAWQALTIVISFLTRLLDTGSKLFLIMHISRTTGGPIFAILCISQPLFSVYSSRGLRDKLCFGVVNNPFYLRMKSLQQLASGKFRQDIISGGLGPWIAEEFFTSHQQLGDVATEHPYYQYSAHDPPLRSMVIGILGDLPMVFCALSSIFHPSQFSITSIAILQQSSMSLRNSLTSCLHSNQRLRKAIAAIKTIYESTTVINSMIIGDTPYPRVDEKSMETDRSKGMGFQLNTVNFSYPGSQSTTPALKGISLTINPGQLIVIVGANGSGKSTLIRILSRLYDPASGEIFIDGLPSSEYRLDDLHKATALLSQDNSIYPLSLAENIGLGCPEYVTDEEMINDAADKGGAVEVMKKLKEGKQTLLDPDIDTFQVGLYGNKTHPLYKEMEKIRKKIDISGGEKQRVVAARSFMRFKSGKVKFVAVDEPSSALDADGELKLFQNLMAIREGKTMVFVTHRFGHLTKHADIIICMKDGTIAETGSHAELMEKQGEYASLYDIQARAFSGL